VSDRVAFSMPTEKPKQMRRMRLDNALVANGLAPSRARARDAILRGHVSVDGVKAEKPSLTVSPQMRLEISDPVIGYVSRAALKLVAALDHFGYSAEVIAALDIGASTGGFCEVLLKRGARRVFALDVGHDQLHPKLATDPRVANLEGINARNLEAGAIGEPIQAITADVSFISLKLALPPALTLAKEGAWGIFLVKPQFEIGRDQIGKGGIVRNHEAGRGTAEAVAEWIEKDMGWSVDGIIDSPIAGGDGNHEYLLGARHG
jgi:23S rRNA (cytidine1920-2'-O)/16S rRNA (cytidine1409-2'-O)-methyltransferase